MNPYTRVQWYLAMVNLHEKLVAMAVQELSTDSLGPLIASASRPMDPEVRSKFFNFIDTISKSEIANEDIQAALGGFSERRPQIVRLLRERCLSVKTELAHFEEYLTQAIDSYILH